MRFQTAKDVRNELKDLKELIEQQADHLPADNVTTTSFAALTEEEFILSADVVRGLKHRKPEMIGDRMTYLDNSVESDLLVFYVNGIGRDQRVFSETLRRSPFRGIAPTLYGWDTHARRRPPLSLKDHSRLLRSFFRQRVQQIKPRRIILVGFSSGADHVLHLVTSKQGIGTEVNGILALGCNLSLASCFVTKIFADPSSSSETLEKIKGLGTGIETLSLWLTVQKYIVEIIAKFGSDIEPLKPYSEDIIRPFEENEENQFIEWYRSVTARVQVVRFVTTPEDFGALDRILLRHLEDNALGDSYSEETIIREEEITHMQLADPEVVLRHTLAVAKAFDTGTLVDGERGA
jgi:hypothetical protein